MHQGAIEVVAYQETLLIMAVFGIALLAMIWAGFRRWLQYKEKTGRMIAEQAAERSAQSAAQMARVEARLEAIEQIVTDRGAQPAAQIEASTSSAADPVSRPDEIRTT